ncbi:hypothetical protein [Selenomonas ruminantium]|uniref:Uncharacterized protein n=1 Tax=Selenomonas ruminantium TaxID=971 RepID=A0A1H0N1T0_SELRU|nr:hypothetical protein [Selenomonas ruminantium]SDO86330.1 hypothetical protein SAMN05216366_102126 [Selenomonas ruminantium]
MAKSRFIALRANISGEMAVDDIPVAGWADVDALKAGDDDPLEVVMAVPAGKSTRGWNYTANALNSIVGEVNSVGLPGFLGHQKAENVATEFPQPVTHWIGAKMDKGVAYFRGLIDKSAPDLKRWVRGKAVSQVSIYGYPQLEQNAVTGETDVTDYKGLSIDWTPLNRAGMPTSVAAISGEMDSISAPTADTSHEELREALRSAAYTKLGGGDRDYVYVNSVYDGYFIASMDKDGESKSRSYKITYSKAPDGKELLLGEPSEVKRREVWEPVIAGEQKGAETGMKKELKDLLDAGTITQDDLKAACGEMDNGKQPENAPNAFEKACGEMFGGKTGNELMEAVKGAAEALNKANAKSVDDLIDKTVKEKVCGEMAQGLVKKMLRLPENPTAEQISGEIDSVLADNTVKAVLAQAHIDTVPPAGSTGEGNNENSSGYFTTATAAL